MAILYGVLRGRPDRFKREDNTSSPHLQIRVLEDSGQPWRIAVNVQSNTGSHVAFWVVDPLVGHPVLASLPGRSQGFTTLAANAGQALDYVKAPLFDFALGRVLPPTGSRERRRSPGSAVVVPRAVQGRRRRDLRVRGEVRRRTCTSRSTSSSATPTACTASTTST